MKIIKTERGGKPQVILTDYEPQCRSQMQHILSNESYVLLFRLGSVTLGDGTKYEVRG